MTDTEASGALAVEPVHFDGARLVEMVNQLVVCGERRRAGTGFVMGDKRFKGRGYIARDRHASLRRRSSWAGSLRWHRPCGDSTRGGYLQADGKNDLLGL